MLASKHRFWWVARNNCLFSLLAVFKATHVYVLCLLFFVLFSFMCFTQNILNKWMRSASYFCKKFLMIKYTKNNKNIIWCRVLNILVYVNIQGSQRNERNTVTYTENIKDNMFCVSNNELKKVTCCFRSLFFTTRSVLTTLLFIYPEM